MMSLPEIVVLSGASVDGKLNAVSGGSSELFDDDTPETVFEPLIRERLESDAVAVGIETVLADNPTLLSEHTDLIQIVVDSTCRLPSSAELLQDDRTNPIVATTQRSDEDDVERLRDAGADVIQTGSSQVDLKAFFHACHERGIDRILVEGGGTLIYSLLQSELVTYLSVVVFPFVIGNSQATTFVNGSGFDGGTFDLSLETSSLIEDNYMYLKYEVRSTNAE